MVKVEFNFKDEEKAKNFLDWFVHSGSFHFKNEVSDKPSKIVYENNSVTIEHDKQYVYMVYDGRARALIRLSGEELEEKLLGISIISATDDYSEAERVAANSSGIVVRYEAVDSLGVISNPKFYEER